MQQIVLVIASLSAAGGAERVLCSLANHWINQGYQVSMLTVEGSTRPPFYPLDPRVAIIRINKKNTGLKLSYACLRNLWECLIRLRKTLKNLNPDLIISFIDIMNVATLLATYGFKKPVIVSERIDPAHRRLPLLIQWLRLVLYARAERVVVQTAAIAAYFPKSLGSQISIIPNAVPKPHLIKNQYSLRPTTLVTVGRLDPQKDHPTLIRAFKAVLSDHPDLQLIIYGEGIDRPKLEALIQDLDLHTSVRLAGLHADIQSVLIASDLFIFPSRYEGIPNALCEAMALGVPVIASNCSGNTEVVQDGVNGWLFPVGDIQALSRIMCECLDDSEQCQRLGTEARHLSERFSPEAIFALWDQQLQNVFAPKA